MEILILLSMGAVAGTLAGLLGIGGGIIIVPVLALVFHRQGIAADVTMHVAIGTSLATMVVTSLSSVRAHHKRSAIAWTVFRRITPGIIAGGLVGSVIANLLIGHTLRLMFSVFMVFVALQMATSNAVNAHRQLPGRIGLVAAGVVIGTVSALMGIGGGSLSVPFMTWCNVPVRRAVGTSAAIGLPIAVTGAIGFATAGWAVPGLPPWSIGYVNIPAFIGIVSASMLFAPMGAALAHRISPILLRRFFAAFLLVLGVRMLLA